MRVRYEIGVTEIELELVGDELLEGGVSEVSVDAVFGADDSGALAGDCGLIITTTVHNL